MFRAFEIFLLYNLINISLTTGQREFCFDIQTNGSNNTTSTIASNITTNTSKIITSTSNINGTDNDVKKLTNIAKDFTFYSACVEVGLGYFTLFCFLIKFAYCTKGVSCAFACGGFARHRWCLCCFHSELYLKKFSEAISPFLMLDAIFFLTIAPLGNIHPLIVTCVLGYFLTVLRILAVVATFVLLFGFRYYEYNEFKFEDIKSLALDFVGLFFVLFSVSSSLATLINLGIPEMKSIRISYAIATFVIVGITYIKYYTTIDTIRVLTANKKTKGKEICYEVMNHLTFWIKLLFGDIVLIVLNLIIWSQHFKEDFRYAGISLISTLFSTVLAIIKYVFFSPFLQNDPLYKLIGGKLKSVCCKKKDRETLIN